MKNFGLLALPVLGFILIVGAQSAASAQGRRGGHGQGGLPAGTPGIGRSNSVGVDRGTGISSDRSNRRADMGRETASDRSNGRSDAGLERARLRSENARQADEELNEHPWMAERLHTTAHDLRSGYRAALLTNPKLTFGQYVAATRLGANLGGRHPNVTTGAILGGLADGKSIGRTLQVLGLGEHEAKDAKKRAEQEVKEAKRH